MLRSTLGLIKGLGRAWLPIEKADSQLIEMMKIAADNTEAAEEFAKINLALTRENMHKLVARSNILLVQNEEYREVSHAALIKQMQRTTPHAKWRPIHPDGSAVPAFRFVVPNGQYGRPDILFEEGMPAPVFDLRSNERFLRDARIMSYAPVVGEDGSRKIDLSIPDRHDMLGFIFGQNISTSMRIGHVVDQRFQAKHTRFQQDGYVYLIAVEEGYNVADTIYTGSGYIRDRLAGLQGQKGVSCQEDACEIGAGVFIPKHRILGARKLYTNGTLGEFIPNTHADLAVFARMKDFIDVQIFLEAPDVQTVQKLEVVLNHGQEKHEDHTKKMLSIHAANKRLNRQIVLDARNRDSGNTCSSLDLAIHGASVENYFCDSSHRFLAATYSYQQALETGAAQDAKKHFYDRKARSEEELKRRAEEASVKLAADTTTATEEDIDLSPSFTKK